MILNFDKKVVVDLIQKGIDKLTSGLEEIDPFEKSEDEEVKFIRSLTNSYQKKADGLNNSEASSVSLEEDEYFSLISFNEINFKELINNKFNNRPESNKGVH